MTTLGEFHTDVADSLARGSSLVSVIPRRVKLAAEWIERNYTFQYMRQFAMVSVLEAATYPWIVSLAGLNIKELTTIRRRRTGTDGTYVFDQALKKVWPGDRSDRPVQNPESYWLNGRSSIILNSIPDEDMEFELHGVMMTQWGSGDAWTHWLLDNAHNLLLVRTLMLMAPRLRDPKLWDTYKAEFDLEIQSFTVSEESLQANDFVAEWEPPDSAQVDESLRSHGNVTS